MSNSGFTEKHSAQYGCGCCAGVSVKSPVTIYNRPGLSAIAYRIGVHSDVFASLLARLSSKKYPALAELRTRDLDDFTIALLDAYAGMTDVLTFYQERIANESYLRTAVERFSLQEMAKLIGYTLNPGAAAETYLAFTLEEADGAPKLAKLSAGMQVQSVPGQDEKPQIFETMEEIVARPEWNLLYPRTRQMEPLMSGSGTIYLRGTTNLIKAGDTLLFVSKERELDSTSDSWNIKRVQEVNIDTVNNRTVVGLQTDLSVAPHEVYVFRSQASLFGYNAPDWRLMPEEIKKAYLPPDPDDPSWPDFTISGVSGAKSVVHLDRTYPQIVPKSWLVLSTLGHRELYKVEKVFEDSRTNFTLSGKTSRLELDGKNLEDHFDNKIRETAVFAESEKLVLAESPVIGDIPRDYLTLQKKTEGMLPGRKLLLEGETTAGITTSEIAELLKSEPDGAGTKLWFTSSLENTYKRETLKIYGNVARATHGETVHQILGSGAAQKSHQRFPLKHAPLTFTSANNEVGTESACEVRVNDVAWKEIPSLYEAKSNDRVYAVTVDEEGKGLIQFGDGIRGARLPTGQENVRSVYRKGLGSSGNLHPGQLIQLLSRPLGLKDVTNPQPSSGGVDAELEEEARRSIPLGVRTLGRAVSLKDFEDYALAYTGIEKAQARVLNIHDISTIFLTVAGKKGQLPDTSGLLDSLKENSDPFIVCDVDAYNEAFFKIALRVKRHPDHIKETVMADVERALRLSFSFEKCDFGQIVSRSEVISVVQGVKGVEGVDIDRFYRGTEAALKEILVPAHAAIDSDGNGRGAELLLLHPGELDYLEEIE